MLCGRRVLAGCCAVGVAGLAGCCAVGACGLPGGLAAGGCGLLRGGLGGVSEPAVCAGRFGLVPAQFGSAERAWSAPAACAGLCACGLVGCCSGRCCCWLLLRGGSVGLGKDERPLHDRRLRRRQLCRDDKQGGAGKHERADRSHRRMAPGEGNEEGSKKSFECSALALRSGRIFCAYCFRATQLRTLTRNVSGNVAAPFIARSAISQSNAASRQATTRPFVWVAVAMTQTTRGKRPKSSARLCAAERRSRDLAVETGGAPGGFSAGRPLNLHQPACKPGSVWPAGKPADVTAIPLVRRLPGASCNLPERQIRTDPRLSPRAVPIRFCSRWGLPCRRRCRKRGALLPHRFTLTAAIRYAPRRSVLCGTVPEARPACAGQSPPDVIRHRLSMEPGLSSPAAFRHWRGAAVRPTDRHRDGGGRRPRQAALAAGA